MKNPLIDQALAERHGDCCADNFCRDCGAHVSGYSVTDAFVGYRPESVAEDWWIACDSSDCCHTYGEGLWQHMPDWVETRKGRT